MFSAADPLQRQISVPELDEQLQEEAQKTSRLRLRIILAKDITEKLYLQVRHELQVLS